MSEQANQLCYIVKIYSNPKKNPKYEHIAGDRLISHEEINRVIEIENKLNMYHNNSQSYKFKKYCHKKEIHYIHRDINTIIDREKKFNELMLSAKYCESFQILIGRT